MHVSGVSRILLLAQLACIACGSSPSPHVPQARPESGPPAQLVAAPAGPDDLIVARVNGRPVYGSCLQAQGTRGATKQQALDQCIGFELLAQAAERFATDREVALATRTALVSELIARDYEDKYTKPADFGSFWDRILERNRQRVSHGEARASAYVRLKLPKDAPPAEEAAAKALMQEVAAKLKDERGLTGPHLNDLAAKIVGTRATLEYAPVPAYLNEGGLVPEYAKALFEIPEVGRIYPSTFRTNWGWDVVLLTELIPAEHLSPQEISELLLPDIKRSYFPTWAQQVAQRLGITPKIYDENVPLLEDIE